MEMKKLFEQLDDSIEAIKDMTLDTLDEYPLIECFPAKACRPVTINGKKYRVYVEVTMREV